MIEKEKQIWILVPMKAEESKRKFEAFVTKKIGEECHVPEHYKDGLVMLLVSPDLVKFSTIGITCAYMADIKLQGVDDFIEKYDEIKISYDRAKQLKEIDFQDNEIEDIVGTNCSNGSLNRKPRKRTAHFCFVMPDGNLLGLSVYKGEHAIEKIKSFEKHWFEVTSDYPIMYGHNILQRGKCSKCGGEIHYKQRDNGAYSWCVRRHDKKFEAKN